MEFKNCKIKKKQTICIQKNYSRVIQKAKERKKEIRRGKLTIIRFIHQKKSEGEEKIENTWGSENEGGEGVMEQRNLSRLDCVLVQDDSNHHIFFLFVLNLSFRFSSFNPKSKFQKSKYNEKGEDCRLRCYIWFYLFIYFQK